MRCLEKKPADRFQTAEALLPALEGLATPSGGMTPTETWPVRAACIRKLKLLLGAARCVLKDGEEASFTTRRPQGRRADA